MACILALMMDRHRTNGHNGAYWMVYDMQLGLHNGVEGIVVWMGIEKFCLDLHQKICLDWHQKTYFGWALKNVFWTGVEKFPLERHQKMSFGTMSKIEFWMGIKKFLLEGPDNLVANT